jgi:hypothetical protein
MEQWRPFRHYNYFIEPLQRGGLSAPHRSVLRRMTRVRSVQSVTRSTYVPQRGHVQVLVHLPDRRKRATLKRSSICRIRSRDVPALAALSVPSRSIRLSSGRLCSPSCLSCSKPAGRGFQSFCDTRTDTETKGHTFSKSTSARHCPTDGLKCEICRAI